MTENFVDITDRVAVWSVEHRVWVVRSRLVWPAGAHIVPTGRRTELVSEVCIEIEQLGRDTVRCQVDITERRSIDKLLDAVNENFGRVDILVNAAGRTARKATAEVMKTIGLR